MSLILPENLKKMIKFGVLNLCTNENLTELDVPNGVKQVVLLGCVGLKWLSLPEGIQWVDLTHCESLTEVVLPTSVRTIFANGCSSLRHLVLREGIKFVYAKRCTSLEVLQIPGSAEMVELSGCTSLKSLVVIEGRVKTIHVNGCIQLPHVAFAPDVEIRLSRLGRFRVESTIIGA